MKIPRLVASILTTAALALFVGCADLAPDGVYAGDKVLYQAELTIPTSYELIHTYVQWEYDNRATLAQWPEIKQSADVMRANAKQWFATAHALREAYVTAPTEENRAALQKALAVLRTALTEASKYMTQAATPASPTN